MIGFTILLSFNLIGVILQEWLKLPIPGNVLGLIIFLLALWTRIIKSEWVERASQLLLKHMILFFIPYVIGAVTLLSILGEHIVSIIISLIGSTLSVLFVTGITAQKLQAREGEKAQ